VNKEKAEADDDAEKVRWMKVADLPALAFGDEAHVRDAASAAFH